MSEICIINCHVHTFTSAHVPKFYPHPALWLFKRIPGLVRGLTWILRFMGRDRWADTLDRLYQFQKEAGKHQQSDIMEAIRFQYPANTRFVVLPMDMAPIGHGPVQVDIQGQHDELARMAATPGLSAAVIPFATIHPGRPGAADEVRRAVEELGFCGLKLYPRLGFAPDHPVLMNEIYPFLAERDLPVMSHCSRGGVVGKHVSLADADAFTAPQAFKPVMQKFPDLRICLAHFGGPVDWKTYVNEGIDPVDPQARERNWQVAIRDMINSGDWPNLWTDISYTLFHFEDNIPFLKLFLADQPGKEKNRLRDRVLFGSDFYMTRQEVLSERAVCFRLRNELGEATFRQIAEINPGLWLGPCQRQTS